MNHHPHTQSGQSRLLLLGTSGAAVVLLFAVAAWMLWPSATPQAEPTVSAAAGSEIEEAEEVKINLSEPAASFETFLHVLQDGGCRLTRAAAIGWLDRYSRERRVLPDNEAEAVMEMARSGGHESWTSGYRQHVYNSAFNALHHTPNPEPLTDVLRQLALHDKDRIMRLYALQHIGIQRSSGRLEGTLADEIQAMLAEFAADRESEVSGTAIQLLADWDGQEATGEPEIQALAAATAADRSRPVDVRVTSIHAAGPASLEVARAIAPDVDEPVILRKAAIARIGEHGSVEDFASLETLRRESSRLAQAADPALEKLQNKQQNALKPTPVTY